MNDHNDLEAFVNGLVEPVKVGRADLDSLSLHELEALAGLDLSEDTEKVAYLTNCVKEAYGDDRYGSWLEQFEGSPLKAKALQLAEAELALEQQRLQKRIERDAELDDERQTWTQQDMLRLQKDMLMLELHKSRTGAGGGKDPTMQAQVEPEVVEAQEPPAKEPPKAGKTTPAKEGKTASLFDAIKRANDIQTVGQINNGDPKPPEWPRAALGVDSAGRRATPEEEDQQSSHGMPDIAHVQPKTSEQKLAVVKKLSAAVEAALGRPFGEKVAADLSQGERENLGKKEFALPAKRKYPIPDEAHARNALARAAQFASPAEQATIRRKVDAKFPGIKLTEASKPAKPTVGLHHVPEKKASVMSTLAMDAGSQAKHLARLGSYARNVQKVPHAVVAARNAEMRAAKALPMPHVDLNAPRPLPSGPATVASKKTPTQAISQMALPRHLAKTNPQQAIQAGRQFGAPVVGSAGVLDQLSQMSFDKLSVSKGWISRTIRRAKATKLRVRDSAQKHDSAWWEHRAKGTELTDAAKKRALAADELTNKYKSMKGALS